MTKRTTLPLNLRVSPLVDQRWRALAGELQVDLSALAGTLLDALEAAADRDPDGRSPADLIRGATGR